MAHARTTVPATPRRPEQPLRFTMISLLTHAPSRPIRTRPRVELSPVVFRDAPGRPNIEWQKEAPGGAPGEWSSGSPRSGRTARRGATVQPPRSDPGSPPAVPRPPATTALPRYPSPHRACPAQSGLSVLGAVPTGGDAPAATP